MTSVSQEVVIIPTKTFLNLPKEKQNIIREAAINEFATRRFQDAKISNIIKESKISRGSFYQYFHDKMDVYKHIFDSMAQVKLQYLSDKLQNPNDLSFLELFRELYKSGAKFALSYPRFVKITKLLMSAKDNVYEQVFKDNIAIALDYYVGFIKKDQELGLMDPDIDPLILARLVVDMTVNVAFDELGQVDEPFELTEKRLLKRIDQIIYIFKKGILR